MNALLIATALLATSAALLQPARACTTFLLTSPTGKAVGKCYDWSMGQGLVLWNKRGVAKAAMPLSQTDRPARWQSKYASLTFNQYGREMPNGGMNEAGLVVEIMWLSETSHPAVDDRPTVNELQWIQYQLDRFATVAEVVREAPQLRVSRVHGAVHYLACDKSGACATFEYVKRQLVIHEGKTLLAPVLTNNTYDESTAYLLKHQGFGGGKPIPRGAGSLERFARAASLVAEKYQAPDVTAAAFEVLGSVNNDASQWHIVYDPQALRVTFSSRQKSQRKSIELSRLDGACRTPVRMIDLQTDQSGDVTDRMIDYTDDADRQLIDRSFAGMKDKFRPDVLTALVRYPSSLACAAP